MVRVYVLIKTKKTLKRVISKSVGGVVQGHKMEKSYFT